ncbi:MAG: DNA polymerase III subunit alpha [Mycoplasma sp.]|nr:DNA polymerase III subunit alpha [Mycoplasma sp.]
MKKQKYAHLHLHDEYSLLDGFGSPEAYVKYAKEQGFEYLAQTNHGNVDGAITFQKACKKYGVKPVFGCELYVVEDRFEKEKYKHLNVLVKNQKGWSNLLRILTDANINGFYRRPRTDPSMLLKHSEGLYFTSACLSSLLTEDWGIKFFKNLMDKKRDLAMEIMPHDIPQQLEVNRLAINFANKYGLPIIATNDCHYIKKEDAINQEVLLAVQSKARWSDPNRWKFSTNEFYLKTRDEMKDAFKEISIEGEPLEMAFDDSLEIAKECSNFEIKQLPVSLPKVPGYEDQVEETLLLRLCEEALTKKVGKANKKNKKYWKRLDHEIEVIKSIEKSQGLKEPMFFRYFLIVWDLIKWANENDIMTGPGRGSAAGSIICWLLNITAIDPIKYNLIFARFISPGRIDLPDIDIDFEDIKRSQIRLYLEGAYGYYNICGVSTFSRLKGRSALKDVARVFDVPLKEVQIACDTIPKDNSMNIKQSFESVEDGKKFCEKYPQVSEIAINVEGTARNCGRHAAAMCVSKDDLRYSSQINFVERKDKGDTKVLCSNLDKNDIEHQGLMKLDVLGLNNLTVLNYAKKLIKLNYGIDVDFYNLSLDDEKVYAEFNEGNTTGCFQAASQKMRRFMRQFGVDKFEDIVHINALFRPGTLKNKTAYDFIDRKNDNVLWEYDHSALEPITEDTYGIIVYQEQIMRVVNELAGLDWSITDKIRKIIAKSKGTEEFNQYRQQFVDGCARLGTLNKKAANDIWDKLSSFGDYSFNLSHAVSYSLITFLDMWTKVNYPTEFICAALTYGGETHKEETIEEAIRLGLDVRTPKRGKSDIRNWVAIDNVLYCPYIEIQGFGEKGLEKMFPKGKMTEPKITKKNQQILDDIRVDFDEPLTDDEAERIEEHFKFSFVKDKSRKFRRFLDRFSDQIELRHTTELDELEENKEYYFFGTMTELNMKRKKDGTMSVYGMFRDNDDHIMLSFDGDLYEKKKELIEHLKGKFLLIKASIFNGSLRAKEAWTEEEIKRCDLFGLDISMREKIRCKINGLNDCDSCDAAQKILPRAGRYNCMIITDNPTNYNEKNVFDTKNGRFVEEYLRDANINARDYYLTSVRKCKTDKKLTKKDYSKCGNNWLKKEIEIVKPFLILSMGNGARDFLSGTDGGITEANGKVEWSNEYECWICYSITPSMLAYQGNVVLMENALDMFIEKYRLLGGRKWK